MNVLEKLKKVNEDRSIDGFGMSLTDWSLPEWGNAVAGEVGEMCNVIKKIHRGDFVGRPGHGNHLLQQEMADVIIYLDLIASREGIDLQQAIIDKFNVVSHRIGSDIKM